MDLYSPLYYADKQCQAFLLVTQRMIYLVELHNDGRASISPF